MAFVLLAMALVPYKKHIFQGHDGRRALASLAIPPNTQCVSSLHLASVPFELM